MKILRTNAENKEFIALVKQLDADLAIRDGEDHSFYQQFNQVDHIKHILVVYENNLALGCGAIKEYDEKTMEIKRMFTTPESRGRGIASLVLGELEKWAKELSYSSCILETGIKQTEAIGLYQKNGYNRISNYGQYAEVENSLCFEKKL